jgi:hypothetical protein
MFRAALFFAAALLATQAQRSSPSASPKSPSTSCDAPKQISPSNSKLYQFLPAKLDFTKLNRYPQVSYSINEDGSVSDVKIVNGTSSAKVDAGLFKSIQA